MTQPVNPAPAPAKQSASGCVKFAGCSALLFIFILLMMAGVGAGLMDVGFALTFGWLQFLKRTLPQISWNWDLIGMGILCSGVILFLAHRTLSWLSRSIARSLGRKMEWPWKWTCCGLVAVVLCFLVGMAIGGAAHQIGWIASSREPWYEVKPKGMNDYIRMNELNLEFRTALLDSTNISTLRRDIWNSESERHTRSYLGGSLLQSYHLLFVVETNENVVGMIIFPRDPQRRLRTGGYYCDENDKSPIPANKLPELISSIQGKLVAF